MITLARSKLLPALANTSAAPRGCLEALRFYKVKAEWQGREDSNPRMTGPKPVALPAWLHPCNAFNHAN